MRLKDLLCVVGCMLYVVIVWWIGRLRRSVYNTIQHCFRSLDWRWEPESCHDKD